MSAPRHGGGGVSTDEVRPPAIDATAGARAAQQLGWAGVVLPPMTLFGVRVLSAVVLDADAHRARQASGDGPQLDPDTLAVWEWPQSRGHAPVSVVSLSGSWFPQAVARRGDGAAR